MKRVGGRKEERGDKELGMEKCRTKEGTEKWGRWGGQWGEGKRSVPGGGGRCAKGEEEGDAKKGRYLAEVARMRTSFDVISSEANAHAANLLLLGYKNARVTG